jgi:ADP-heptose:LPS heptosyltransferase
MEFLKPLEISFRQFLLRSLELLVRRGRSLPAGMDFSKKKFLFVRQDRIGDVLVSTPLIHALKEKYPSATLDFLLSSNNHFVLQNEPLVRKRWIYRKTLAGAIEMLKSIRGEHYDFVIDLMDNPSATSTVLCALAGGKWNVGLSKENAYSYDVVVPLLSRKEYHIVDRLAMLLTVFGVDRTFVDLRIHYSVSEESEMFAERWFNEQEIKGQRVIGINISPGEGTRIRGVTNYQGLIRRLKEEYKRVRLVVLHQPSDITVAQTIVGPFTDVLLSPETETFDRFAAIVRRVWILVTPDTSAVHLAAAFSIPSVVLYVQSNKDLRIWEPYAALSESLVTDVDDLKTIPLDSVVKAIARLVTNIQHSSRRKRKSVARSK